MGSRLVRCSTVIQCNVSVNYCLKIVEVTLHKTQSINKNCTEPILWMMHCNHKCTLSITIRCYNNSTKKVGFKRGIMQPFVVMYVMSQSFFKFFNVKSQNLSLGKSPVTSFRKIFSVSYVWKRLLFDTFSTYV